MGITDFSSLSKNLTKGTYDELVSYTREAMKAGLTHEELVADPKVVKLGIDSSFMRIKLRCRYLPKIVEKLLESSPHLVHRVLENSDSAVAESVAEHMASITKAMLDSGVYQIYYFLEGESHIPKICLAKRKARKDASISRFEDHIDCYVRDIQGIEHAPRESCNSPGGSDEGSMGSLDEYQDEGISFEDDVQIEAVPLKKKEKQAIRAIATQYTSASVESASDRCKMVNRLAKLAEDYPGRLMIVSSQHEAELDASFFYHIGLINHLYTVDTDALVYGVPTIITDIITNGSTPFEIKYRHFDGYSCGDLRFNAGWERIAIAVMLGCDYNRRLPGVGRVTACNRIESLRKKMNTTYASLLAGQENDSTFALWIKCVDKKFGHEPLTFTCQEYADLVFTYPAVAPVYSQFLAKMVATELVKEKHMNTENWEMLGFAKCFMGFLHPLIMASQFKKDEEKKQLALSTIDAYKTQGFTGRYKMKQ